MMFLKFIAFKISILFARSKKCSADLMTGGGARRSEWCLPLSLITSPSDFATRLPAPHRRTCGHTCGRGNSAIDTKCPLDGREASSKPSTWFPLEGHVQKNLLFLGFSISRPLLSISVFSYRHSASMRAQNNIYTLKFICS
jgi:hypothetical protein